MTKVGRDPLVVARARGPEFTKVDDETERRIPFRTWLTCIVVSVTDIASAVMILILLSRQFYNFTSPPRVYGRGWGSSVWRGLLIWWPSIGILMFGSIIAWSVPLLYRFLVETVAKHPPQYTPYPSEYGLWNPLGYRAQDEEDEEYEREAETVNLNLWEMIKGKRKKMRSAPGLLYNQKARAFYRAVAEKVVSFSERGAKSYGINPVKFTKRIRDPLLFRELATWKDEENHNLGVNLTDEAFVTLGHLGKHSPAPPAKRA